MTRLMQRRDDEAVTYLRQTKTIAPDGPEERAARWLQLNASAIGTSVASPCLTIAAVETKLDRERAVAWARERLGLVWPIVAGFLLGEGHPRDTVDALAWHHFRRGGQKGRALVLGIVGLALRSLAEDFDTQRTVPVIGSGKMGMWREHSEHH